MIMPKWRNILFEYSSITTIHGMKQLIVVGVFRKLLWATLLISCSTLLVMQVSAKVSTFLKNPVNTNVEIKYLDNLTFPAVAICNTNWFRIGYIKDNLYDLITELYLAGTVNRNMDFSKYQDHFDNLSDGDSLKYLKEASSHIDDMLLSCNNPDGSPCTAKDFELLTTDFGICYAYNSDSSNPIVVETAGVSSALYLLLNIEGYERSSSSTYTTGVKILIYDQQSVPIVRSSAVDVSPGFKTNIGLDRFERRKILPQDGGECSQEMVYETFSTTEYNVDRCKVDKQIVNIINKCGCMPYFGNLQRGEKTKNLTICSVEQHFKCVVFHPEIPKAANACPSTCYNIQFSSSLSFSKYPEDFLTNVLGENETTYLQMKWHNASEIRTRIQADRVHKMERLIHAMEEVDRFLREVEFAPIMDYYLSTFGRLKIKTPCFGKFLSDYDAAVFENQQWNDIANNGQDRLLENEQFVHILHPEIKLVDLIEQIDVQYSRQFENETELAREKIRSAIEAINYLLSFFRVGHFLPELSNDMKSYVDFFRLMEEFEKGGITKLQWAMKSKDQERLINEMSSNLFRPIQANLGRLQTLVIEAMKTNKNNKTKMDEIETVLEDPKLYELLTTTIFNSDVYRSDDCMAEKNKLNDDLQSKWNNKDNHPNMLDSPERIVDFCHVEPPRQIRDIVNDMEQCIFTEVGPNITKFLSRVERVFDKVKLPFDQIIQELRDYEWNHLHTNYLFEQNIIGINIYYQDMSVETFVQEKAYDGWSLLCDVGGTLGLCLGASLVTLFEMVDFFMLRPIGHWFGMKSGPEKKLSMKEVKEIKNAFKYSDNRENT